MGLKNWYGGIKTKYDIKSIKLITMVLTMFIGTISIFALKGNPLDRKINSYVKTNLSTAKDYKPVQVLVLQKPDSIQLDLIKRILLKNEIKLVQYKYYKIAYNQFQNNDTVYINHVILNRKDVIITMDEPSRQQ